MFPAETNPSARPSAIASIATIVVPAFDYRYGWSQVPAWLSLAGEAAVLLSFWLVFLVLRANSYSASTIQVVPGQQVVSTGPYARVRHPMYAGVLPMLAVRGVTTTLIDTVMLNNSRLSAAIDRAETNKDPELRPRDLRTP